MNKIVYNNFINYPNRIKNFLSEVKIETNHIVVKSKMNTIDVPSMYDRCIVDISSINRIDNNNNNHNIFYPNDSNESDTFHNNPHNELPQNDRNKPLEMINYR